MSGLPTKPEHPRDVKYKQCGACQGLGYAGPPRYTMTGVTQATCRKCNGTGVVPIVPAKEKADANS